MIKVCSLKLYAGWIGLFVVVSIWLSLAWLILYQHNALQISRDSPPYVSQLSLRNRLLSSCAFISFLVIYLHQQITPLVSQTTHLLLLLRLQRQPSQIIPDILRTRVRRARSRARPLARQTRRPRPRCSGLRRRTRTWTGGIVEGVLNECDLTPVGKLAVVDMP